MTRDRALLAITGASGRVGRHLCEEALRRGYRIRGLGRTAVNLPGGVEHASLDLAAEGAIAPGLLEGCGALLHLAAYIPRDHGSVEEGRRCWDVNVAGTARLLEAAGKAGVGFVVQLSSANAYAPWVERTDETAPLFPRSRTFYLSSKIAQEVCGAEIAASLGLKLATLRLSSVYDADPSSNLIANFAARLLRGDAIELADEGRFGADFVLANDVVRAVLMVLEARQAGTFNVGSGRRSTLAELTHELLAITGADRQQVRQLASSGTVDEGFPAIVIARLQELGYQPTGLREGVGQIVAAQRNSSPRRR